MQNPKAVERALSQPAQASLERRHPAPRIVYPATITAGILAVKRAVHEVGKTGRNKFHNYSYATEADVLDTLREPMNKAGLALIPSQIGDALQIRIPKDKGGGETVITQITIEFQLVHESGDVWPVPLRFTGHGQDSQDKGPYKAMAGARKYAHIHIFGLTTTDDPENDSERRPDPSPPPVRPNPPVPPVRDLPGQGAAAEAAQGTQASPGKAPLSVPSFKADWAKLLGDSPADTCWDYWLAVRQDLQVTCASAGEWAHVCKLVREGMAAHDRVIEHVADGLPTWAERHGKS